MGVLSVKFCFFIDKSEKSENLSRVNWLHTQEYVTFVETVGMEWAFDNPTNWESASIFTNTFFLFILGLS